MQYIYIDTYIYISQQKHPTIHWKSGYPNIIFISSSVVHHTVGTSQAIRVAFERFPPHLTQVFAMVTVQSELPNHFDVGSLGRWAI